MYDNQEKVDEIEKQVRQVSPGLGIREVSLYGNLAIKARVKLPVKGNKDVIKKLEELGWRKVWKEKVRTDRSDYVRCQYKGYTMRLIMEIDVG